MKHEVSKLEGALLDLAVAIAGEEWKTAHEFFPTMTLDPTFSGARIVRHVDRFDGPRDVCMLVPHNPFRQDPQHYSPSTLYEHGGPIIERERFDIVPRPEGLWWAGTRTGFFSVGPTYLVAAMRAFVVSKVGVEIELP